MIPDNQNLGETRCLRDLLDDLKETLFPVVGQDDSGEAMGLGRDEWKEQRVLGTSLKEK